MKTNNDSESRFEEWHNSSPSMKNPSFVGEYAMTAWKEQDAHYLAIIATKDKKIEILHKSLEDAIQLVKDLQPEGLYLYQEDYNKGLENLIKTFREMSKIK